MTALAIVGGVYHEHCAWPEWHRIFGSGGRAAAAATSQCDVTLTTLMDQVSREAFLLEARMHGFECELTEVDGIVSFDYLHPLAPPKIGNGRERQALPTLSVNAQSALSFGMLDANGVITAERCVYDPQNPVDPRPFGENGSRCNDLAVVANEREVTAMAGDNRLDHAAKILLAEAAVVVAKMGMKGATVYTRSEDPIRVPAFLSSEVFSIGSGDVFAAIFASAWAVQRMDPTDAALLASKAVAEYVESRSLPSRDLDALKANEREAARQKIESVYLAAPFFSMAERMMVDETKAALEAVGIRVFSPFHEIGPGPAEEVAPADLAALQECDAVFALVDGLDAGTIFEIGYATALRMPVHCLSHNVGEGDLKMIEGSGGHVHSDLVSAAYRVAWNK
jgi:hypothetical protein